MSAIDKLAKLERAVKTIADREAFAQDGAIYAYDAETCFRVGSAENAAESDVSAAIGTVIAAAPLLISEIAALRAALARHKTAAGPAESVHAALGVSSREAARAAMAHGVPCPTCGAESSPPTDTPAPCAHMDRALDGSCFGCGLAANNQNPEATP